MTGQVSREGLENRKASRDTLAGAAAGGPAPIARLINAVLDASGLTMPALSAMLLPHDRDAARSVRRWRNSGVSPAALPTMRLCALAQRYGVFEGFMEEVLDNDAAAPAHDPAAELRDLRRRMGRPPLAEVLAEVVGADA